ncbi:MAG: DNA-processing protein DprA [Candidatus Omnitrophica bacterium]|nr:DNA-processing protein DprA [Candidatus Omnitrophota bacterium]
MNTSEALIGLNMIGNLGSVKLSRLLEYFSKPEDIFKSGVSSLSRLGISAETACKIISFDPAAIDAEISSAEKIGLKIVTLFDKLYPKNLLNISACPLVLYCLGDFLEQDNCAVAIVGSRRASIYGLNCASKFAGELAAKGVVVVSGLARGIDTYAHRGALKAGGRTLAVLGSGFNQLYPPENRKLAEEISYQGVVISEFPLNTLPLPQNFPRRNRLISGLSLGVLVVEAAKNSGALITADFALEQNRDVFALPGKIDSFTSTGVNLLIQQGAKLVTCCDDILEELYLPLERSRHDSSNNRQEKENPLFDKDQQRLYHCINENAVSIDQLVEISEFPPARLSRLLLDLRLAKLIKELPGKYFARN